MADSAVFPVWVFVNGAMIRAAWRSSYYLSPEESVIARIGHVVLLCWALIVIAATLLSLGGLLSGWWLLGTVGGLAGLACLGLKWSEQRGMRERPMASANTPQCGNASQKADNAGLLQGPNHPNCTNAPERIESICLALWGAALAYAVARIAIGGVLEYPEDWDTLMYHLPLINQWLQACNLYAPGDAVWFNPGNSEIVGLWMVAPFSGDFLIALNNLPSTLLLFVAAQELAKRLALGRFWRHLLVLAALSNWVVFRQMLDAKNDVAVAALFFAALAYGIRFARDGGWPAMMYSAIAAGLLSGVKYYAVPYALIAALILGLLSWVLRGTRALALTATLMVLAAVMLSGYWYGRNAWVSGTPIYPKGVVKDTDLVMKIRPDLWSTTLLGSRRPEVFPLALTAVQEMAGVSQLVACLVLPCTLFWLVVYGCWMLHQQESKADAWIRWAMVALTVCAGVILGFTPFGVETNPGTLNMLRAKYLPARFGLCFLTLSVSILVIALQDLAIGLSIIMGKQVTRSGWGLLAIAPHIVFATLVAGQCIITLFFPPQFRLLNQVNIFLLCGNIVTASWVFVDCWKGGGAAWPDHLYGIRLCCIAGG